MTIIERNDQPEDQTKDEKGSPSSEKSNSGKAETAQLKSPRKAAAKKKTARKKAAKKAVSRVDPAKTEASQPTRAEIHNAEPNSSDAETKPVKPSRKVAAKKKTARKKAAKKAVGRMEPEKTETLKTTRAEIHNGEANSSEAETKQIKPSRKATVRKKTARKKAAKTVGSRKDSAKMEMAQATRTEIQLERPAEPAQSASVTGGKAVNATPAEQIQPEKPVAAVSPATAPPHSKPAPRGGTGLMGFWIKLGISAFVIIAGVIGIYSFFSDDGAASRPAATQAATSAQGGDASVAGGLEVDAGRARGVVFPPATEQSNRVNPESLRGYNTVPGTFAGAGVANGPIAETANTAGVTRGITQAADQALANQRSAAPPTPHSGQFSQPTSGYRPELYRPLEPEKEPPPPTQPSAASETPRASSVPAPTYYPQPGTYAFPPAPGYGGSGRYYPY